MKYKVWASVYQGNGNREEANQILVLPDHLSEEEVQKQIEEALWELLVSDLDVETGYDILEDD